MLKAPPERSYRTDEIECVNCRSDRQRGQSLCRECEEKGVDCCPSCGENGTAKIWVLNKPDFVIRGMTCKNDECEVEEFQLPIHGESGAAPDMGR